MADEDKIEELAQKISDLEDEIGSAKSEAGFAKSRAILLQQAIQALVDDNSLSQHTRNAIAEVLEELG